MQERTYRTSDWAVRRWDGFNDRLVEPLSFCQFWRTVLLYVTISQLLGPVRAVVRLRRFAPSINLPGLRVPQPVSSASRLLLRGLGRGIVLGLWLLTYPFRLLFPPAGRAALAGVVAVGEPIVAFGERHKDGLKPVLLALLIIALTAEVIFLLVIALLASWFWTLVAIGGVTGGTLAIYGFFKSGAAGRILAALDLLWRAAVAAKHGICPPVRIVREV